MANAMEVVGWAVALVGLATCSACAQPGSLRVACGSEGVGGAGGLAGDSGGESGNDGWVSLFNGTDLTGWTPSPGAEPLFAADRLDGEPVIHVYPTQADQSGQPQATLRTQESFGSYVFHLEYKWGTNRYSDRKQTARDSGICFHLCNDLDQVWPDSFELQIGSSPLGREWITGDVFVLGATRADWTYTTTKESAASPGSCAQARLGQGAQDNRGRVSQQLNKNDQWNVVELVVHGARGAEYTVNGAVVNRLHNLECNLAGTWAPAERGPIAVQAEFAELYFRNLKIKMLP